MESESLRTAARIETILRRHGRSLDPELCDDTPPKLVSDEPALAACYGAAAQGVGLDGDRAGRPTLRLLISPDTTARVTDDDAPVAEVRDVAKEEIVDDAECVRLMTDFIRENPALWNEDIGEC